MERSSTFMCMCRLDFFSKYVVESTNRDRDKFVFDYSMDDVTFLSLNIIEIDKEHND